MALPPNYGANSPPSAPGLSLPGQRPSLSLPNLNTIRRKPSTASTISSAHPLRQTSFPPPDSLEAQHALAQSARGPQYSPSDDVDISDSEINSAINGPSSSLNDEDMGDIRSAGPNGGGIGRKRKRPGVRGRPRKNAELRGQTESLLNGSTTGRAQRGATAGGSVISGPDQEHGEEDEGDEADDDVAAGAGGGTAAVYEGGRTTEAEREKDKERRAVLYDTLKSMDKKRYELFHSAKFKKETVRKLVNQTLSQSVPPSVITAIEAYTKLFTGTLIEEARQVQAEQLAATPTVPTGDPNPAFQHNERLNSGEIVTDGASGGVEAKIEDYDRGPLTPDHLREALRRYKTRRSGGTVGFTGLSLAGREITAPKMGGKRMFR